MYVGFIAGVNLLVCTKVRASHQSAGFVLFEVLITVSCLYKPLNFCYLSLLFCAPPKSDLCFCCSLIIHSCFVLLLVNSDL